MPLVVCTSGAANFGAMISSKQESGGSSVDLPSREAAGGWNPEHWYRGAGLWDMWGGMRLDENFGALLPRNVRSTACFSCTVLGQSGSSLKEC